MEDVDMVVVQCQGGKKVVMAVVLSKSMLGWEEGQHGGGGFMLASVRVKSVMMVMRFEKF